MSCAICGKEEATTKDHIIPRGIFTNPRPSNMITVPACLECNQKASKHEEAFLVYLSLHVGDDTEEKRALWERHALRTLTYNRRLTREILRDSRWVNISTPSGIIYSQQLAGLWNSEAHDIVIERMIRGLYYHHFKEILGEKVTCRIQWLRNLNDELINTFEGWPQNIIGDGQLVYKYGQANEELLRSTWLFQFYERHWASGYTVPL